MGTPSFSLNLAVNLYLNNISIVGSDWVEGLRNLSISSPPGHPMAIFIKPIDEGGAPPCADGVPTLSLEEDPPWVAPDPGGPEDSYLSLVESFQVFSQI